MGRDYSKSLKISASETILSIKEMEISTITQVRWSLGMLLHVQSFHTIRNSFFENYL